MTAVILIPSTATVPLIWYVLLVAVIVIVSCTVASLAGFGGNLLALPFLTWVCGDLWLAVVALLLLGTIQSVLMAITARRHVQWRPLSALVGWSVAGLPIGMLLAIHLPMQPAMLLMGLVIALGGMVGFAVATGDIQSRPFRLLDRGMLLAAGVMHGAFGCGGPTIVLAARRTIPEKHAFRGTLFVFWIFLNGLALTGLMVHLATPGLAMLMAISIPGMLAGSWSGQQLAHRVSQRRFGELVAILLVTAGLATIVRAWS
jgi:uncharacterized membrane protein YfcA